LACRQDFVDPPRKAFPTVSEAQAKLDKAVQRLQQLRENGTSSQEVRTAECDWFGAEEAFTLAKAANDGRLNAAYDSCLPAEIQIITVGSWSFVGWPAEIFVEYALAVKNKRPNTFVISLANGELQGYIVTKQAVDEGGYEASNGLFSHETGQILVDRTLQMLQTD